MVIGVKGNETDKKQQPISTRPNVGQSAGHMLNSVFIDSWDSDIEQVKRINKMAGLIPKSKQAEHNLKEIDLLVIEPSEALEAIASKHQKLLARSLRFVFKPKKKRAEKDSILLSYLLFEKAYCHELIKLGYKDAMKQRDEIEQFFAD